MAMFDLNLFTPYDFLQIENVLYTPREEEMAARRVFKVNTSYAAYAREVGYDYYMREGRAKILAGGARAQDIDFVSEKGGRVTNVVYDIATGIRYTDAERAAILAKRALGKGPAVQLDTLRVSTARRFILEQENVCAFNGASGLSSGGTNYDIKGILHNSFYDSAGNLGRKENVATGATGATDALKRLWTNKTAQEIQTDLLTALSYVEKDGLFKARALILPPAQYNMLRKPWSAYTTITLLDWLNSSGMYFEQIIPSRVMKATAVASGTIAGANQVQAQYGNGDSVDYFMVLDNDPEVIEMVLTYDIRLGNPVYDILNTMEQSVMEGFGGVLFRHPAGCYVGKGI
jgi:hypothetical protein